MGDGLSAAAVHLFTLSLLISPRRNFFGGEWIKALAVVEFLELVPWCWILDGRRTCGDRFGVNFVYLMELVF